MDVETERLLLDRKLAFLTTVAQTTMTWWLSSMVFCVTMVGAFWWFRSAVANLPGLNYICSVVFAFLLSFPIYAAWIIYGTDRLEKEATRIAASLRVPMGNFFEYRGVKIAVLIGAINFSLVVLVWCYVWFLLNQLRTAPA